MMAEDAHIVDMILDRRSEVTHMGRQWRFAIIQHLANQADAETVFGKLKADRFCEFIRQGPHYIEPIAHVALGSS